VEITYLVIPGYNDRSAFYESLAKWMADRLGPDTPLHFSAHFPRYRLQAPATTLSALMAAQAVAKRFLNYVYLGNVSDVPEASDTLCRSCGATLVARRGYEIQAAGLGPEGQCAKCAAPGPIIVRPRWMQERKG